MTAASVTGTGSGSADKVSPPLVPMNRLTGPFGPRILMAGVAQMSEGEVTITHPQLPSGWNENTMVVTTSYSAYSVFVTSRNSELFIVNSLETGSYFSFSWMIITTGFSFNLTLDI